MCAQINRHIIFTSSHFQSIDFIFYFQREEMLFQIKFEILAELIFYFRSFEFRVSFDHEWLCIYHARGISIQWNEQQQKIMWKSSKRRIIGQM